MNAAARSNWSISFSKGFLKYSQNGRSIQLTEPGGKPKIYRDGSLLTKSDGQRNGTIVNVSFFLQEEKNKPFEKVRARFCLSCFKEFIFINGLPDIIGWTFGWTFFSNNTAVSWFPKDRSCSSSLRIPSRSEAHCNGHCCYSMVCSWGGRVFWNCSQSTKIFKTKEASV